MRQVVLASHEIEQVSELLREVSRGGRAPSDVKANAMYWADTMGDQTMEPHDLQRLAWLLLKISDSGDTLRAHRRSARYWATYLRSHL